MGRAIRRHAHRTTPRSISHLTRRAAEDWCLENVTVPLDRARPLRARHAVLDPPRVSCAGPRGGRSAEESTFTLQTLIDVLSREREGQEQGKSVEAGPFRLSN